MNAIVKSWFQTIVTVVRRWWSNHQKSLLWTGVGLMVIAALWRLANEFPRLLWEQDGPGAIDLKKRFVEVQQWFAGLPVYGADVIDHAVYPPASYVILWPFLGWLDITPARWLWAAASLVSLMWLSYLSVRECKPHAYSEFFFIALLAFSIYPATATIRVGQLIVLVLPMLTTGLIMLNRKGAWSQDLVGAVLILLALVSPTITAPFVWIVLFLPSRMRPAILVVLGYMMLTLVAASFQETPLITLIENWLERGEIGAAHGAVMGGTSNMHTWLGSLGLEGWNREFSLIILGALGIWIYRYRHVELWLLIGVSAITARLWAYHRLYDDLLMILPMIALFRIAKHGPSENGSDVLAGALFTFTWVTVLSPASVLTFPPPWNWLMTSIQTVVWLAVLVFLLDQARREKKGQRRRSLAILSATA